MQQLCSSRRFTIHHLPTELIAQIFREYATVELYHFELICMVLPPHKTSMVWVTLMLVCKRWREIGLRSPTLWRVIHVTSNLEALQYRLARSSPCTIDVVFGKSVTNSAMSLLIQEAKRIRSIYHDRRFPISALSTIQQLLSATLPALENIVVEPYRQTFELHNNIVVDLCVDATLQPAVKKLVVSWVVVPRAPSLEFWSQLRVLKVEIDHKQPHAMRGRDMANILASAPHLEVLALRHSSRPAGGSTHHGVASASKAEGHGSY